MYYYTKENYESLISQCIQFENDTIQQCQMQREKLSKPTKNVISDVTERGCPAQNVGISKFETSCKSKSFGKHRSESTKTIKKLENGCLDKSSRNDVSDTSNISKNSKPKRSLSIKNVKPKYTVVHPNTPKTANETQPNNNLNNTEKLNSSSTQRTMIFQGYFDTLEDFSSLNSSQSKCCYPNCARDNSDHDIAIHTNCQSWMHTKCFVDWVYTQRKNNKQLICPKCKKPYFAPS